MNWLSTKFRYKDWNQEYNKSHSIMSSRCIKFDLNIAKCADKNVLNDTWKLFEYADTLDCLPFQDITSNKIFFCHLGGLQMTGGSSRQNLKRVLST